MPNRNPDFKPASRLDRFMQRVGGIQWFFLGKGEEDIAKVPSTIVEQPKNPVFPLLSVDVNLFLKDKGFLPGDTVKLRVITTLKEDSDTTDGHTSTFIVKSVGVEE